MLNSSSTNNLSRVGISGKQAVRDACCKLACVDTMLQHKGELISDDAKEGARVILHEVIDSLEEIPFS